MKNFRKVLALVLVMATLFSFTAMAGAAYKDEANISYDEAVAVLSAVGILNGYEDGTFKPTNTISREEMAKMIAVLANAGDDVSKLYASASTFADVPEARWSASYVAYCAKTGIVAGRSASTFDPTGKVTGLETAKMLLVLLGFDAAEQGYVGADWKVNVLRDAKVMGLLQNFPASFDIDVAITREQAAQMMLNALESYCVVGSVSNNLVNITNALIVEWPGLPSNIANLTQVTAWAKLKDALDAGKWCLYGNVLISNDRLCDRLFNMKSTTGADCFGRPSTIWTIGGVTLVAFPEAPIWSSTATTKAAAELKVPAGKTAKWITDGKAGAPASSATLKGTLVEVYADGTIVAINTYIGTVCQVNTARGTFAISEWFGNCNTYTGVKNTYGFKPADEGTTILYWVCNGSCTKTPSTPSNVHAVEVVEAETLTVHGTRYEADYFCSKAGDKYEYNINYEGALVDGKLIDGYKLGYDELGTTIRVFTDKYGYVLAWADILPEYDVAVLVAKSARAYDHVHTNYGSTHTYDAKFVEFEDGAKVGDYIYVDAATYALDQNAPADTLVAYQTDASGKRVLAEAAYRASGDTWTLNKASGLIGGASTIVGNTDTQYLLRVFNYMTGKYEYKYFDGKNEIDGTYLIDELQYFRKSYNVHSGSDNPYLAYVYAEASYAKTSAMAFVQSFYTEEDYITEGGAKLRYFLYKAIINGEPAYVAYETKLTGSMNKVYNATYQLIIAESHDGLPIYMACSAVEKTIGKNFAIEGETLVYWTDNEATKAYADMDPNAVIWAITVVDKVQTVKQLTFAELVELCEFHGWTEIYGWMSGNPVNLLYVYAVAQPVAAAE